MNRPKYTAHQLTGPLRDRFEILAAHRINGCLVALVQDLERTVEEGEIYEVEIVDDEDAFHAINLADSSLSAFYLPDQATCEAYVEKYLCRSCLEELRQETTTSYSDDDVDVTLPVTSPLETACGAEWIIAPAAEWDAYEEQAGPGASPMGFLEQVIERDKEGW